jgi:archaellum component FlaC
VAIDNSNVTFGNFRKGDNSGSGGHNDGGNGSGGGMEERLRHVEQDMSSVKTTLIHIQKTMATKAEMYELRAEVHALLRQQIMWSVGTIIAMAGLVFAIMRFTGS